MTLSSSRSEIRSGTHTREVAMKRLQNRDKEWPDLVNRKEPLQLLHLPLDVLQVIIKEVTHTNDLTSLALTHSILHTLVIPHIYSRFDIVWPDAGPTVESRAGVDALTYGLATLVMAQDVFGELPYQKTWKACANCGSIDFCQHRAAPTRLRRIRRGNNFAQFTRKFSLGNGPEDWVKEYLITKESGKMLGTLVALALGRMRNLESFTWDMPTGVLRDVWLALASLDGRDDDHECRLEQVWVRWHDNQDALLPPPILDGSGLENLPHLISRAGSPVFQIPPYPRVVFPTFSVLPPLRSLSALDIDELSYVEEMSVLLERSLGRLQELRIGLARHTQNRPWARPREDRSVVPPPPMQSGEHASRPGGLLGILVNRFCSVFGDIITAENLSTSTVPEIETDNLQSNSAKHDSELKLNSVRLDSNEDTLGQLGVLFSAQTLGNLTTQQSVVLPIQSEDQDIAVSTSSALPQQPSPALDENTGTDQRVLRLNVLELERVALSIPVLSQAFDWCRLRTLTLLGCRDHEPLWKSLRKRFTPPGHRLSASINSSTLTGNTSRTRLPEDARSVSRADYQLQLQRLHTDTVSLPLLAFLKDTLAPDSLEYLFLQQSPAYKTSVTIDQIYKHAIRRHRSSLQKLLIDSDIRAVDGSPDGGMNWRKWAANRELITCITSGRMHLRELSISIDFKDWHHFLQRLPNASGLRSIHVSHIADYVHTRIDAKEAALQILDIVALRPELELCYVGIQNKCFEILEFPNSRAAPPVSHEARDGVTASHMVDDDDISDEHDEHEHEENGDDSDGLDMISDPEDEDEANEEAQQEKNKVALRLREILFYDDKVSIFKARHGQLVWKGCLSEVEG